MDRRRPLRLLLCALVGCLLLTACRASVETATDTATPAGEPVATATVAFDEPAATTEPVEAEDEVDDPPSPSSPTAAPSPAPTVEPVADAPVSVHDLQLFFLRDTQIAASGFTIETATPAAAAVKRLLAGTSEDEAALGFETAIPVGTQLLNLTIGDGVAVVDLSGEFETAGLGTSGELALVAQIVFTLTQFDTVDEVDFWIDGQVRDAILSHGLEATGVGREELYEAVAPEIVVEMPAPGAIVGAPFEVTGFSRTFESNVQWEVTSPEGAIVTSGFTTASQPDVGKHGPFQFTVDPPADELGAALLTVFDESAEDGSRINVYEVPILLGADSPTWLRVNGFGPIDFGASAQLTEDAVTARFGPPDQINVLDECPSGPATIVDYDDFSLLISDGTFEGWFYTSSNPALTTPSGVAPGITQDELVTIYTGVTIEESTLGQEFFFEVPAGFIGGFLTGDGATVTDLYAGTTCFFR